jgi:HEAT repeat protein
MRSLGKIGDPAAIDALLGLARASSVAARKTAIGALARFRDQRVIDALTSSLSDSDEEVRAAAASGLGEIGDQRAIPNLEKLVDKDPSSDVRAAAVQSIERLRLLRSAPPLKEEKD